MDLGLPEQYTYEYDSIIGLDWRFDWTDIQYSYIVLAMKEVTVQLTKPEWGLIKFDFPAIKNWTVTAHQEYNSWLFPSSSNIELVLANLDIDVECDLVLDD